MASINLYRLKIYGVGWGTHSAKHFPLALKCCGSSPEIFFSECEFESENQRMLHTTATSVRLGHSLRPHPCVGYITIGVNSSDIDITGNPTTGGVGAIFLFPFLETFGIYRNLYGSLLGSAGGRASGDRSQGSEKVPKMFVR